LSRAQVAFDKISDLGLSLQHDSAESDLSACPETPTPWACLELVGVTHDYNSEGNLDRFTVGPIDIVLHPGELVFLIGGNGSGKTTLAKILAGLYAPQSGEIRFNGEPVTNNNRDDYRQNFSALFSDYYLFDRLFGVDEASRRSKAAAYLKVLQLDHKVEINDGRLSSTDLSSGQRKRLALLTAYLENRSVYIFDEWAADQDTLFKQFFYCEILPELKAAGKTLVVITHDDRFFHLADRVIKLENGKLEYDKALVTSNVAR
jgi:putative ATP-binding cassette transporter